LELDLGAKTKNSAKSFGTAYALSRETMTVTSYSEYTISCADDQARYEKLIDRCYLKKTCNRIDVYDRAGGKIQAIEIRDKSTVAAFPMMNLVPVVKSETKQDERAVDAVRRFVSGGENRFARVVRLPSKVLDIPSLLTEVIRTGMPQDAREFRYLRFPSAQVWFAFQVRNGVIAAFTLTPDAITDCVPAFRFDIDDGFTRETSSMERFGWRDEIAEYLNSCWHKALTSPNSVGTANIFPL
jgi:hypothetical protein